MSYYFPFYISNATNYNAWTNDKELFVYGLSSSLLNNSIVIKNEYIKAYVVLVLSMIIGRLAYGLMNYFIFKAGDYSLSIWLVSAFVTSLPGILIQLMLIPILVVNAKKLTK